MNTFIGSIMIWLSGARIYVVLAIGLVLWGSAYWWYFKSYLKRWLLKGKPHPWSIDMVNKKAISRGKEEVR